MGLAEEFSIDEGFHLHLTMKLYLSLQWDLIFLKVELLNH